MKLIPLNDGFVAKVSDEDYDRVMTRKWYAVTGPDGRTEPVGRIPGTRDWRGMQKMYHFILGITPSLKCVVDHKNFDTLDNRRENIRICTHTQNMQNQKVRSTPGKSSKFKGPCFIPETGKYRTRIRVNGKIFELGNFSDEKEAALAYDRAAVKYFGEFANINFPDLTASEVLG